MKKPVALLVAFCLAYMPSVAFARQTVQVRLPDFPVVLNGKTLDNENNLYPLISYKDIVYFPMAYNYAAFMRLKSNWHANTRNGDVLFIGVAESAIAALVYYEAKTPNRKEYGATAPSYKIALNTLVADEFLDNSKEEYPLLNFRDVTYFPLTWKFAVEEFGWTYSFEEKTGLRIDSKDPFRPVIDDSWLGNRSPSGTAGNIAYFYGEEYYVGYPNNAIVFNSYDFIVRKKNETERRVNLKEHFAEGQWYFNAQLEPGGDIGFTPKTKPSITGNIFSLQCVWKNDIDGDPRPSQNLLLKFDLDTCALLEFAPLE